MARKTEKEATAPVQVNSDGGSRGDKRWSSSGNILKADRGMWRCENKTGVNNYSEVLGLSHGAGEAVGGAGGSCLNVPSCFTPLGFCALHPSRPGMHSLFH